MSKIYQPKHNSDNWIPHELYMQIIHIVRDYDGMVERLQDKLEESPAPSDGQPRGTGTSDPTFNKAQKISVLHDRITAIDSAVKMVPEEYREGILDNIRFNKPFPDYASMKTWTRWKGRLIKRIGENLYLL